MDEKRPFYKSSIHYTLSSLPDADTIKYLTSLFNKNGKKCAEDIAQKIHTIAEGCPDYIQKLSYYIYDIAKDKITDKQISESLTQMLLEETPLFEMMLQNLRPGQISFLSAIAKEPTATPFTAEYLSRHNFGSLGGIQSAIKKLIELAYIEKTTSGWKVVDPIFKVWLKKREKME